MVLTIITLYQMCIYTHGPIPLSPTAMQVRRVVFGVVGVFGVFAVAVGAYILAWGKDTGFFSKYSFIVMLSLAKVVITLVKYFPQVYMNYARQSTVGWNINNVLLDFIGGTLSVGQLLIDCSSTGDYGGLIGDPAKLALGNTSMVFDVIFMIQHYCLYKQALAGDDEGLAPAQEGPQVCPNTDCGWVQGGEEPLLLAGDFRNV